MRQIHDAAYKTASNIIPMFLDLLDPEQVQDVFSEIYLQVKKGIEEYELRKEREVRRINPH